MDKKSFYLADCHLMKTKTLNSIGFWRHNDQNSFSILFSGEIWKMKNYLHSTKQNCWSLAKIGCILEVFQFLFQAWLVVKAVHDDINVFIYKEVNDCNNFFL